MSTEELRYSLYTQITRNTPELRDVPSVDRRKQMIVSYYLVLSRNISSFARPSYLIKILTPPHKISHNSISYTNVSRFIPRNFPSPLLTLYALA
jgi:hypothetical protein